MWYLNPMKICFPSKSTKFIRMSLICSINCRKVKFKEESLSVLSRQVTRTYSIKLISFYFKIIAMSFLNSLNNFIGKGYKFRKKFQLSRIVINGTGNKRKIQTFLFKLNLTLAVTTYQIKHQKALQKQKNQFLPGSQKAHKEIQKDKLIKWWNFSRLKIALINSHKKKNMKKKQKCIDQWPTFIKNMNKSLEK